MRQETINLYTFDELSDTSKEKAIEAARNSDWLSEDWRFRYDDLQADLKTPKSLVDLWENSKAYNVSQDTINLVKNDTIAEIKCIELDVYRNTCTCDISYCEESILDYVIATSKFPKAQHKFLRKLKDDQHVWINYDSVQSSIADDKPANKLIDKLDDYYQETVSTIKTDIEHFCLKYMRDVEEDIYSDDYISDMLIANDYEFTVDGKIY